MKLVLNESNALVPSGIEMVSFDSKEALRLGFKLVLKAYGGASAWASTFTPIAVYYKKGLWLIGPISLGAFIGVGDEVMAFLHKRYPENAFFKACHDGTFVAHHAISGLFADIGFAWYMINTLGLFIGGQSFQQSDYAKLLTPVLSLFPALLSRYTHYQQTITTNTPRTMIRHVSHFFRGAISSSGAIKTMAQQHIFSNHSPIPLSLIGATAVMGLLASILKESTPDLYLVLIGIIEIIFENASLAATFLHVPLDIDAAINHHHISEGFFYSMVALTALFYIASSVNSAFGLYETRQKERPILNTLTDVTNCKKELSDDENLDTNSTHTI